MECQRAQPRAQVLGLRPAGDWSGHRVSVENASESLEWQTGTSEIEVDMILSLIETGGMEWLDSTGNGFHEACCLALHSPRPVLIAALVQYFGPQTVRLNLPGCARYAQ